jgi:uncharacterized protein (TIGR03790 family)
MKSSPRSVGLLLLILSAFTPAARALTAEELLLVVNSKVPESRKLAEFYASQRQVPAGRICALDLPFPQEDLSPAIFDAQVLPKVRAFLSENGLKDKVKCLVTFWGVPLRIQHRQNTPAENQELGDRDREIRKVEGEIVPAVVALEGAAAAADPTFKPAPGDSLEQLARRAEAGVSAVRGGLKKITDAAKRETAYETLVDAIRTLAGRGAALQEAARPELLAVRPQPAAPEEVAKLQQELLAAQRTLAQLQSSLHNRDNRDQFLTTVKAHYGLVQYVQALRSVRAALDNTESTAAFDSELSLVWMENYPKQRWIPNLLHHGVVARGAQVPRVLMVMRIDGPDEPTARRLVSDSILAEHEGLTGLVALDARGNHGQDAYGQYDQTIRNLADLLKAKTKLDVRLDDKGEVFAPDSLKDVALYCGWYSLRNYVRGFTFHRGAVGFHIASSELVSLRNPGEKAWVPNLLKDGVVGSLGPVAEPYLHSFPRADEFFPLLLTGRLTLAEVYWKTNPLGSWMNACVGDPLYRPYAKNPPLKVTDLPPELQKALGIGAPLAKPGPTDGGPPLIPGLNGASR